MEAVALPQPPDIRVALPAEGQALIAALQAQVVARQAVRAISPSLLPAL